MERRQLPRRLDGIQNALEHVASELCYAADDARKGKLNTNAIYEKLMGLSSVVSTLADQVQDAEAASRLSDEEELGQVLGQVFFPRFLGEENAKSEEQSAEQQGVENAL
jgi:hypothetical protein